MTSDNEQKIEVFFDGACPLCRREIGFYQRRRGADRFKWVDVSRLPDGPVADAVSRDEMLARFHVRGADGELVSGGAAFALLWAALPGFRLLGRLLLAAPLRWVLDPAYDLFLRLRPALQSVARRG